MAAEGEKKRILEMVQADGSDEGSVTFVMHDEDHTLGNSLRYMIMKDESVEFCGYTITHPSESKINFRIQTRGVSEGVHYCSSLCALQLAGYQFGVSPAYCPKTSGIDSSTPTNFVRRKRIGK